MVDFEELWVTIAQEGITYNRDLCSRLNSNFGKFGVQNEEFTNKIKSVMGGLSAMIDPFLEESIRQVEERGLEGADDCVKGQIGTALGTLQSVVLNLVDMHARLCMGDYGCDYDNLVQSGTSVSNAIDELRSRLVDYPSLLPPSPVINFTYVENPLDVYYQTDILFFWDLIRTIPEYKLTCAHLLMGNLSEDEMIKIMMGTMEVVPQLIPEYGNIVNVLSHRLSHPIGHDWGVTILSLLEADMSLYQTGTFFGIVDGAEGFKNCMVAQADKAEAFLERLRSVLRA